MGKRAVLSPKTRQNQLQLRADEVERNQKRKDLHLAIKNWPRVILPLHAKLQSLGVPMDRLAEVDPTAVLSKQATPQPQDVAPGVIAVACRQFMQTQGMLTSSEKDVKVPQRARLLS